ncbi:hypothetical protein A9Q84_18610 [Halobacteriovorax marinus]|uniref:Uncharacterized protein n=1 Tax=Halobacteriovorax marinus TaxID=97084 RepID=A0A1Y5F216_9BACT|nr:hypothetical protein A9Q84_18610 [Halobacteriovorax marinus]
MKQTLYNIFTGRLNLSHLLVLVTLCTQVQAGEKLSNQENSKLLASLNPYAKTQQRTPSNYVPDVETSDLPGNVVLWYENILVEDTSGVMKSMRKTYESWNEEEEYVRNWDVESTGLYDIKDQQDRKAHFNKYIIKYLDKRLSGEIKQAEEGSTMHRVGSVQKALKPQTSVAVSKFVKFKFKARVLQGKALMYVENPWVQNTTTVKADGTVNVNMNKDISELGLKTNLDYNVNDGDYVARVDRPLTKQITARITSSQTVKEVAFTDIDNQTFEVLYNYSF